VGEHAGDNLDTGSDIVVELTAVGGRFWKKSGFDITSRRRRLAAAAAPPPPVAGSVNPIFLQHQHRRLLMPMFQRVPMSPIFDVRCVYQPNPRRVSGRWEGVRRKK